MNNEMYVFFGLLFGVFFSIPFYSVFWASWAMAAEDWQNLFGLHHQVPRPKHYMRDEIAKIVGLDKEVSK